MISCADVLVIILVVCCKQLLTENVTFTPKAIHIKVSDLPRPYATLSARKGPRVIPVPPNPRLFVPNGFSVKVYATGLDSPRYMIYTPSGDILVSEPWINRISCLLDTNNDGYPDQRTTFADASNDLNRPYGMAFAKGFFYVGNEDSVRRYAWTRRSRQISGRGKIVMNYTSNGHWTRTVIISPAVDRIYVGIGSATNVNIENLPRASVQQARLDGKNRKTFAFGLRNPIGLAFHPLTNDLYVACQERDGLGDDLVPDFFTRLQKNDFYGWPYSYMSSNLIDPRRLLSNGTSERPDLVLRTRTPDVLFQAHSAVLDMQFYTGKQFPDHYKNGAFVAMHGSWNRHTGTGYKLVFIPFNNQTNQPIGYYEDFITGFLTNPSGPDTFGRPVGLLVLKDGSLLFSEDGNDRLYQVQYNHAMRHIYQ